MTTSMETRSGGEPEVVEPEERREAEAQNCSSHTRSKSSSVRLNTCTRQHSKSAASKAGVDGSAREAEDRQNRVRVSGIEDRCRS